MGGDYAISVQGECAAGIIQGCCNMRPRSHWHRYNKSDKAVRRIGYQNLQDRRTRARLDRKRIRIQTWPIVSPENDHARGRKAYW